MKKVIGSIRKFIGRLVFPEMQSAVRKLQAELKQTQIERENAAKKSEARLNKIEISAKKLFERTVLLKEVVSHQKDVQKRKSALEAQAAKKLEGRLSAIEAGVRKLSEKIVALKELASRQEEAYRSMRAFEAQTAKLVNRVSVLEKAGRKIVGPKGIQTPEKELCKEAADLLLKWSLPDALQKANEALEINPLLYEAWNIKVETLTKMGEIALATEAVWRFHALHPLRRVVARQMRALGITPPVATYENALDVFKSSAYNGATATHIIEYLHSHEMYNEALEFFDIAIISVSLEPREARRNAWLSSLQRWKALSLENLARYEDAATVWQALVFAGDAFRMHAAAGLARCRLETGQPRLANTILTAAYADSPDPRPFTPLWMDALQAVGSIKEAYVLYRKRPVSRSVANFFEMNDPLGIDIKSGRYLDKKVLLLSEGGPGDELRLSSVYSELSQLIGDLTITCDPRLESVLVRNFPDVKFLPTSRHRREFLSDLSDRTSIADENLYQFLSDRAAAIGRDSDLVCMVTDTLVELRPEFSSFGDRRKIQALDADRSFWAHNMSSRKIKIGISWRSLLQSAFRNRYYFGVRDLSHLSRIENAEFWLLQPNATAEELAILSSMVDLKIAEGIDLKDDFEGQLALMSNLDFIVSPFTTTGEMGGALGVPTMLLSLTGNTLWRRRPDGTDIFSSHTKILSALPYHDRASVMQACCKAIDDSPRGPIISSQ